MIQKSTIINIIDKCGIMHGNTFHIYKGFKRKYGFCGDFLKFSSVLVQSSFVKLKSQKFIGILVRSKKQSYRHDGSFFLTKFNSVVSLKKRLTPRGKELLGPANKKLLRKKFLSTFSGIF